jgi:hypothetical protein
MPLEEIAGGDTSPIRMDPEGWKSSCRLDVIIGGGRLRGKGVIGIGRNVSCRR